MIVIPRNQLSDEALTGLIEEFVTRSGTDYGCREASLDSKCAAIRAQLASGKAQIVFDPTERRCNIVLTDKLRAAGALAKENSRV